jgi:hypothetical protein
MGRGTPIGRIVYRIWQVWAALSARPLTAAEWREVEALLPADACALFATMTVSDQRHCLSVQQALRASGCGDRDLLQAALLHDVGKGGRRVPFWIRPTVVLLRRLAPRMLTWLAGPCPPVPIGLAGGVASEGARWRQPFRAAWHHAAIGANLAAAAGLGPRAALLIRTHHQPDGPAAALHAVDDEL